MIKRLATRYLIRQLKKASSESLGFDFLTRLQNLVTALEEQRKKGFVFERHDPADLWVAWIFLYRAGKQWGQHIIDHLAIPVGKAKAVELAVRTFSKVYGQYKSPPGGITNWFEKNERHLLLLKEALTWKDRSEDTGLDLFQVGPFRVHNTIGVDATAIEEAKAIILQAVRALPSGMAQMAYGDLFLVGQLGRKNWAAWYTPEKDTIYLRPKIRGLSASEGARHLVHELGHRFWAKKLSKETKSAWNTHHWQMSHTQGQYTTPGVGDILPFVVNNKKVRVENTDGIHFTLADVKTDKLVGKVDRGTIRGWMAEADSKGKFPSLYAATDAEEHFCESLSLKAFGDLTGANLDAFVRIFGML